MGFEITTNHLRLTEVDSGDVAFIHELFNDPDCLRFIGDRGIHTTADALDYIQNKLIDSYRRHGYGLFKVTRRHEDEPLGICGLVKRYEDKAPDIGFGFLAAHRSHGYCTEAGEAVLSWAKHHEVSNEILAFTDPENEASIRVLEKLGLQRQEVTQLPGQDSATLVLKTSLLTNRSIA